MLALNEMSLMKSLSRGLTTAALSATLVVGLFAQDNKDTIQLKSGETESGKIKSEDYDGVVIDVKTDKTVAWKDIQVDGITYFNAPMYQSAKEQFGSGKLDEALKTFEEMRTEKSVRPVIKQHAYYYIPFILQRQGKLDEALAAYKDLLTTYPKSRYLLDVGENYVSLFIAKKDAAGGAKAIDQLANDALTAGVDATFSSAMNVQKGRLLEYQSKFAEAQGAYTVAERATGVSPTVVSQAVLGLGRCAVALGDKTKAESLFRKVANSDGPSVVMAGAWNGLGDLLLEEGKGAGAGKKADADKILDALYCYLRGVVQYSPLPGDSTDEYERSLAFASECFNYLSQLDPKPEGKAANKARADARKEQLRREYPNSIYLTGK